MLFKRKKYARKKSALDYVALPHLPELGLDPETKKGIWVVILIALGAISLLGLFGMAGEWGKFLDKYLTLGFGWGKWLVPVLIMLLGYLVHDEESEIKFTHYLGVFVFVFSFQSLLMLFVNENMWTEAIAEGTGGGYVGLFLAKELLHSAGGLAAFIILLSLIIISLMLIFRTGLSKLFGRESALGKMMTPISFLMNTLSEWRKNRKLARDSRQDQDEEDDEELEEDDEESGDEENDEDDNENEENDEEEEADKENDDEEEKKKEQKKLPIFKPGEEEPMVPEHWWQTPTGIDIKLPLSLLDSRKEKPTSGDIKENQEIIKRTLENFGIMVEMGEVTVGPTVTQYTLKPAEGVKLSKITTLNNDLALALASHPIRIEAPIPGKRLVGVEVPNQIKAMVSLKEIMTSRGYDNRKNNSYIALGKDVAGTVWLDDISKMPHLLVAGATNSGKSVCLNSIIVSLLYQNNPDELRFIMVDPKRVEMQVYNGIPYLLTPVITDASKTITALKWCLGEMERRFDVLSQAGHKNIQTYNASVKTKMPYIVFVIDELADLMSVAAKEVEAGVNRLAALARAVGIHLVLATQRPSVDIITGVIKSNMPARIAFSVASGTDSRTIIDTTGAEKLLGRGDMLFQNAEMSRPVRLQGAFLSDDEIRRIVRYIKEKGGQPNYLEDVTSKQKGGGNGFSSGDDGDDELLSEAKEIIINQGKASASFLQRKLSVGYNRAARMIDLLEQMGVIGPANGSKPREILVSREQYEASITTGVSGVSLHSREESIAPDEFLNSLGEEADAPPVMKKTKIEDDIDWEGDAEKVDEEENDVEDAEAEGDVAEEPVFTSNTVEAENNNGAVAEVKKNKEVKIKKEENPSAVLKTGKKFEIKDDLSTELETGEDDPSYKVVKEEEDDERYFSR